MWQEPFFIRWFVQGISSTHTSIIQDAAEISEQLSKGTKKVLLQLGTVCRLPPCLRDREYWEWIFDCSVQNLDPYLIHADGTSGRDGPGVELAVYLGEICLPFWRPTDCVLWVIVKYQESLLWWLTIVIPALRFSVVLEDSVLSHASLVIALPWAFGVLMYLL